MKNWIVILILFQLITGNLQSQQMAPDGPYLPESTYGDSCWGVAPLSLITMYSEPSFSSEIVSQALLGTPVRILEEKKGWLRIQTPEMYTGWTNTTIRNTDRSTLSEFNSRPKAIVTGYNSFVYEKPSDRSQLIMEVIMGDILLLEDIKKPKKYTAVILPDGTKGYISSGAIMRLPLWQESIRLTGDNIVNLGMRFLGMPYIWGGTSGRGFDCSGFTKTVYYMHGIILPRDASQQYYSGDKVDITNGYEKLQPGDLLFFGHKSDQAPDGYRVTHVGIYVGDKKYIHESGKVRINSFDPGSPDYSEYNVKHFVGARRIIGSAGVNFWKMSEHNWYK